MSVTLLEKKELFPAVIKKLEKTEVVLDIGCGIMPQQLVRPLVHICCEPFVQYVEHLKNKTKDEFDRQYIIINADWREVVEKIPDGAVDSIFLIDVVEHLEKEEGLRLLCLTERIARRQIVLFTPLGFMPQEHPDGKDAWGLEGGTWQEHKSGWLPEDFGESWDIYACEEYHLHDNMGMPLEKPFGVFWAIKNICPTDRNNNNNNNVVVANPTSIFNDVILCLESLGTEIKREDLISGLLQKYKVLAEVHQQLKDEYQLLKDEHQLLKQTRAVILARKIEEYPLLKKLISMGYDALAKPYNRVKRME